MPKFDQNQCKVQLKLAISRLKLQKTKKDNQIKDHKREIADLLRSGKDESARIKVESVIREDFIIEAYEILELFCELILARLGVIQISKDCPPDLREAVCTIIYAAPRAEVKELNTIREMLIAKFGKELALAAVHNKDNCVNARIVHKLSIQTPENYLVFQYLNEIAKAHNLEWKADFAPEPVKVETVAPMTGPPMFPDPPRASQAFGGMPGSVPSAFGGMPGGAPSPFGGMPSSGPQISFPSPPTGGSHSPVPTFNPHAMPGNFGSVPSFPGGSAFPDFPSPPTSGGKGGIPDFPSPPTGGSSFPDFPSPPSGKGTGGSFPDFPSPPTGKGSGGLPDFPSPPTSHKGSDIPDFPSPPSGKGSGGLPDFPSPPPSHKGGLDFPSTPGTLDFPSPPSNDSGSSVPDFDELTARFEKLKKRDT